MLLSDIQECARSRPVRCRFALRCSTRRIGVLLAGVILAVEFVCTGQVPSDQSRTPPTGRRADLEFSFFRLRGLTARKNLRGGGRANRTRGHRSATKPLVVAEDTCSAADDAVEPSPRPQPAAEIIPDSARTRFMKEKIAEMARSRPPSF